MITFLFILLVLGQLGRISFFDQQINIYLYEIYLIGLISIMILRYKLKPLILYKNNLKPVFLFLLALLVSFAFSFHKFTSFENIVGFLYLLRLCVYLISFSYLQFAFKKDKKIDSDFSRGFLLFVVITGVFFLIQYIFYPDLRNLYYLGWDPHLYRVFGVYFDTSTAGAIVGIILLYTLLNPKLLKLENRSKAIILTFYSVVGALIYSRGFYLSILITLLIFLATRKYYKYIVMTIFLFIGVLFALPKPFGEGVNLRRTFSIESRLTDYKQALDIWKQNPLFGVGYNRLRYIKQDFGFLPQRSQINIHSGASFHSSFLIVLTTAGLVGLFAFVYLLMMLASTSEIAKYLVLFLSLFSLWDNVFLHPFVLILFFLVISPFRRLS